MEKEKELSQREEAEIFFPKGFEKVNVKDREYEIKPLTLEQMDVLLDLQELDLSKITKKSLATLVLGIASVLGEEDVAFIKKNVDLILVKDIFAKVRRVSYKGIPEATDGGTPKGKAQEGN